MKEGLVVEKDHHRRGGWWKRVCLIEKGMVVGGGAGLRG